MLSAMLDNMTTAECRKAALQFERNAYWFCAGLCYDAAAANHPGNRKSRMYQLDRSKLLARAAACYAQATSL
jgi:hypothetical protein